jgi:hypothetical protein
MASVEMAGPSIRDGGNFPFGSAKFINESASRKRTPREILRMCQQAFALGEAVDFKLSHDAFGWICLRC